MKRIITLIATFLMLITLCSCSNSETDSHNYNTNEDETFGKHVEGGDRAYAPFAKILRSLQSEGAGSYYSNDRAMLYDLTGDAISEMILLYDIGSPSGGKYWPSYWCKVYMIENGTAREKLSEWILFLNSEKEQNRDIKASVSVARKNGELVLVIKEDAAALSDSGHYSIVGEHHFVDIFEIEGNSINSGANSNYYPGNEGPTIWDSDVYFSDNAAPSYEQWLDSIEEVCSLYTHKYNSTDDGMSFDELLSQIEGN